MEKRGWERERKGIEKKGEMKEEWERSESGGGEEKRGEKEEDRREKEKVG